MPPGSGRNLRRQSALASANVAIPTKLDDISSRWRHTQGNRLLLSRVAWQ
jgi:hypothetical protein